MPGCKNLKASKWSYSNDFAGGPWICDDCVDKMYDKKHPKTKKPEGKQANEKVQTEEEEKTENSGNEKQVAENVI